MKKGMTLEDLTDILEFHEEHKQDFILSTEEISVLESLTGTGFNIEWTDYSRRKERRFEFDMTRHMLKQVAQHVEIPMTLIDNIITKGTKRERKQLAELITARLQEHPTNRMIRTMPPHRDKEDAIYARAFLSDRYRVLDNAPLMQAIFPVLQSLKGKLKIQSCHLSSTHLYIKLRYPSISGSLGTVREEGVKVDDIVEAGVLITNSEVGDGPVRVQPYMIRLTCMNGATIMITQRGHRKNHIGRRLNSTDTEQIVSDEAFFAKVAQSIVEVVKDKSLFKTMVKRFRHTKTRKITGDIDAVLKALGQRYTLTEDELTYVKKYLGRGSSQFHLINAVTRAAQVRKITYDRGVEMEGIGGRMIELTEYEWKQIGGAKTKEKKDVTR